MSFGKRNLPGTESLPRTAPSTSPQKPTRRPKGFFSAEIWQALAVLMIGGLVVEYHSLTRNSADFDGSEFAMPQYAAGRHPLLAERPQMAREVELSLNRQCIPDYATKLAKESEPNIHPLAVRVFLWTPNVEPPMVQMRLGQAAQYLDCAMKVRPQRLCQPYFRKLLAMQLWSYGQVRALAIRQKDVLARVNFPSPQNDDDPMAKAFHESMADVINGFHDAQVVSVSPFDPRILDGVRNLSRNGYLQKSDFGKDASYAPPEIVGALATAEVRSCP